jgi:uncharacterized protein (TIGR02145 family)
MRTLIISLLLSVSINLFSQAPALIAYQAVARDAGGQFLSNASLMARFTIHDFSASGEPVWQEMQTVNTNALGLFAVQLGITIPLTIVNWSNGNKFMQVEIDLGQGYVDIGTQQMLSVPYALFSSETQHSGDGYSHVSYTGDTLFFNNGNFIIIPGLSVANGGVNLGCTNSAACNYNTSATEDDGSCHYLGATCNDNNTSTYNDIWTSACSCEGTPGITGTTLHTCGATNIHNPSLSYGTMTDQQGNEYKTILIGAQEWMAENLNTSIYRNGDFIATNLTDAEWQNTNVTELGAWAYYNNNPSYACPYGKLYNWYACVDQRNLCPAGWHVPSDNEWSTLINFLSPNANGGSNWDNNAGIQMKTTGTIEGGDGLWYSPNESASNSSGFSGVPAGSRNYDGVYYNSMGKNNYLWTANESTPAYAQYSWMRLLGWFTMGARRSDFHARAGYSVRCVRD